MLQRGVRVVAAATVIGIIGAFGAARLLAHQLFSISAADPLAFTVAPAILIGVALLACYLPARRAANVDPMVALRSE